MGDSQKESPYILSSGVGPPKSVYSPRLFSIYPPAGGIPGIYSHMQKESRPYLHKSGLFTNTPYLVEGEINGNDLGLIRRLQQFGETIRVAGHAIKHRQHILRHAIAQLETLV